jgi:hypothetical protein
MTMAMLYDDDGNVYDMMFSDGQVFVLNLNAQLCLKIGELLLERVEGGEDNVLRFERSAGLHVDVELVGFAVRVIRSFI